MKVTLNKKQIEVMLELELASYLRVEEVKEGTVDGIMFDANGADTGIVFKDITLIDGTEEVVKGTYLKLDQTSEVSGIPVTIVDKTIRETQASVDSACNGSSPAKPLRGLDC